MKSFDDFHYSVAERVLEGLSKAEGDYFYRFSKFKNELKFLYDRLGDQLSCDLLEWYLSTRMLITISPGKKEEIADKFRGLHAPAPWSKLENEAKTRIQNGSTVSTVTDEVVESNLLGGYTIDDLCMPQNGDVVFDLGVFNGNNSLIFSSLVGEEGKVYGFEPLPRLFEMAKKACSKKDNIELHNLGIGAEESVASINDIDIASHLTELGNPSSDNKVSITTIDRFVEDNKVNRCDFIKMDIEGFEVDALVGAQKTLREFRPTCMIAAYHKPRDLFMIPKLIDQHGLWYTFYFRHYHWMPREMVLYAIPKNQNIPAWAQERKKGKKGSVTNDSHLAWLFQRPT